MTVGVTKASVSASGSVEGEEGGGGNKYSKA